MELNATHPVMHVLESGKSVLQPTVPEETVLAMGGQPEHLELVRMLGHRSAIRVPLTARNRTFGVLTLVTAESAREYSQDDLGLAEEIGRRAGLAVDQTLLYQESLDQRQALQTVPDSMTEGVVAVDADLRIRRANTFAGRLLGLTSESLTGRPCHHRARLLRPADRRAARLRQRTPLDALRR